MVEAGHYYKLKVVKKVDFGLYLDADGDEILLPKRFVPKDAKEDDELDVFVYHDNEERLIATTQKPIATVGEIALMEAVTVNNFGAFLKWGIMKDVFIPLSLQASRMAVGNKYLVYLFIDEKTGRVTATEKLDKYISNYELTVQENDVVDLIAWQQTDIGYKVIINNKHLGVLHFSDVFRNLEYGERLKGFIKKIRPQNKIDIGLGDKGYERVLSETDKILLLLKENDGYLPYNDKSSPEEIYGFFGVSKKTFKMAVGALYKERKIELTKTGIKLLQ